MKAALEAVCRHHDGLRLQFIEKNGSVIQRYAEPGPAPHFEIMDLRGNDTATLRMTAHMNALQSGMNLEKAELVKAAVYRLDEGDRLFISVHHLVVDAFSFRILLEDLNTAYSQSVRHRDIGLLPKTSSFRTWAEEIQEYAHSDALDTEKAYWRRIAKRPPSPLPSDFGPGENTRQQAKSVHGELSDEETAYLLTHAHRAHDTQADDLLLAALARAAGAWTGEKQVAVFRAVHGREPIADDVDVSRTVGWFSGMCPILFTLPDPKNTGRLIVDTRDELRKIPRSGIGYGLLRYIRKDRELFRASGIFKYKLAEDAFYFGDSSKVIQDSLVGNRLIYKNKRGTVEAEGRFNLGEGLKYISVDAAGTAASACTSPQDTVKFRAGS